MTDTTNSNAQIQTTKKRILTGITTTGIPHLGNYVGAIRPAIQSVQNLDDHTETDAFFFWQIITASSNAMTEANT